MSNAQTIARNANHYVSTLSGDDQLFMFRVIRKARRQDLEISEVEVAQLGCMFGFPIEHTDDLIDRALDRGALRSTLTPSSLGPVACLTLAPLAGA